jgi:hypothetical protein
MVWSLQSNQSATLLAGNANGAFEVDVGSGQVYITHQGSGNVTTPSTAVPYLTAMTSLFSCDGTNYHYVNQGASLGDGSDASMTFAGGTAVIGPGAGFVRSKITEMVIWDTAFLSSGDQTALHSSQANYFSIT